MPLRTERFCSWVHSPFCRTLLSGLLGRFLNFFLTSVYMNVIDDIMTPSILPGGYFGLSWRLTR